MLSPTFSFVSKCPVMILLYTEKPKPSLLPMKREGMQSLHKEVEGKMKRIGCLENGLLFTNRLTVRSLYKQLPLFIHLLIFPFWLG